MNKKYILKNKEAIAVDTATWARWFEKADLHVAEDEIGDVRISTVFLGLDYQRHNGPPLIFATFVFGGNFDGKRERYSTWKEAIIGHKKMVEILKKE